MLIDSDDGECLMIAEECVGGSVTAILYIMLYGVF